FYPGPPAGQLEPTGVRDAARPRARRLPPSLRAATALGAAAGPPQQRVELEPKLVDERRGIEDHAAEHGQRRDDDEERSPLLERCLVRPVKDGRPFWPCPLRRGRVLQLAHGLRA